MSISWTHIIFEDPVCTILSTNFTREDLALKTYSTLIHNTVLIQHERLSWGKNRKTNVASMSLLRILNFTHNTFSFLQCGKISLFVMLQQPTAVFFNYSSTIVSSYTAKFFSHIMILWLTLNATLLFTSPKLFFGYRLTISIPQQKNRWLSLSGWFFSCFKRDYRGRVTICKFMSILLIYKLPKYWIMIVYYYIYTFFKSYVVCQQVISRRVPPVNLLTTANNSCCLTSTWIVLYWYSSFLLLNSSTATLNATHFIRSTPFSDVLLPATCYAFYIHRIFLCD